MSRLIIELDGVSAAATLLEDKAPRTCAGVKALLPIDDRTIQVRWSGAAWRTEKNYRLAIGEVENPVTVLQPGDIIYYDEPRLDLFKIGIAYGKAAWRDMQGDIKVAHIGRITGNLDAFMKASDRIIFEGPKRVRISLAD